ncbi:MAG: FAD:protein FMN transferase [Clostridiales bacterium]
MTKKQNTPTKISNINILGLIAIIAFNIFLVNSCNNNEKKNAVEAKPHDLQNYIMGTLINQRIYNNFEGDADEVGQKVFEKLMDMENSMSAQKGTGSIIKLNKSAGNGQFIKLNKETYFIVDEAKKFYEKSNQTFDISMGPLIRKWNFSESNKMVVPSKEEIEKLLEISKIEDLELDPETQSARLKKVGESIDLGGCVKGYAGDKIIELYKENGVESAFINLGGNVVTLGSKPNGDDWVIGIQNPRATNGRYIGTIKVKNKTVVTSGDYERYFEKDGTRYHHILNPKDGYPARSGIIGVSIISDSSTRADFLSTSAFILGLDEGMKLVESFNDGCIFITDKKKIYVSDNLKSAFKMDDSSKEFEYVEKR